MQNKTTTAQPRNPATTHDITASKPLRAADQTHAAYPAPTPGAAPAAPLPTPPRRQGQNGVLAVTTTNRFPLMTPVVSPSYGLLERDVFVCIP